MKHTITWSDRTFDFWIWQFLLLKWGEGAPCIGYRTISFLVKIQSPFFVFKMAYSDHLGYCIQHLMNKIGIFWFQVLKKCISKTGKMRKWPKTSNFGVFEWLNQLRANFALLKSCIFFTIFGDYDGWEAEKSHNRAQ